MTLYFSMVINPRKGKILQWSYGVKCFVHKRRYTDFVILVSSRRSIKRGAKDLVMHHGYSPITLLLRSWISSNLCMVLWRLNYLYCITSILSGSKRMSMILHDLFVGAFSDVAELGQV